MALSMGNRMTQHKPITDGAAFDTADAAALAPPVAPLAMPKQVLVADQGFLRRVLTTALGRVGLPKFSVRRVH